MATTGYRLDDGDVCGDDTLCGRAAKIHWSESLLSDECAAASVTRDNEAAADYVFATAKHRQKPCADGAAARCSPETSRFTAFKLAEEVALQGRDQAGSNKACPGGFHTYLKPSHGSTPARNEIRTGEHTRHGGKACGTVSEAEMDRQRPPRPGAYHAGFAPFAFQRPPSVADAKVVTLATARHPDWDDMKAERDRLQGRGAA